MSALHSGSFQVEMALSGKTVIVTGGASGIGRAIAEAFGSHGAQVMLSYFSSSEPAARVVAGIQRAGGQAAALHTDVTKEQDIDKLVAATLDAFGGVDVLVANAGGLLRRAKLAESSRELWDDALAINLTSVFLSCRAVEPHMRASGGSIIAMTSLAAHDGGGLGASHYAAAKGGVLSFVRAMAKELAPTIRVNGIAPGLIGTQFHDRFTPDEARRATVSRTPLGREGSAVDVADAAVFLASSRSSFITGEIIEVNGGLALY